MPANPVDELANLLRSFAVASQNLGLQRGRTGKLNDQGAIVPNPQVPGQSNRVYVRLSGSVTPTVCWNYRVSNLQSDIAVWVGQNPDGEYEILRPIAKDVDDQFGYGAAAFVSAPEKPVDLSRELINTSQLVTLRAYRDSTKRLSWSVQPGWIGGRYFPGSFINVGTLPDAGYHAWYQVGINQSSLELVTYIGTPVLTTTPLTINALDTNLLGNNVAPLAAAVMKNTTVSLDNVTIIDTREFVTRTGPSQGGNPLEVNSYTQIPMARGFVWLGPIHVTDELYIEGRLKIL